MYLDFVIITNHGGRDPEIFLGVSPLQSDSLSWSYAFCSLDCQKVVQKNSHVDWGALQKLGCPDGRACVRQGYTQTF